MMTLPSYNNYNRSLKLIINDNIGSKSCLKPPELMKAYEASMTTYTPDVTLMRAATDLLVKDNLMIPIYEPMGFYAAQPYVMDSGLDKRETPNYWNPEDVCLNK